MAIILSNYYSLFIRLPEEPERETYFDKEQRIFTESRDNCGQAYLVPIPQAAKTDICAEYLEMRGITAKNKDDFEDEVAYMEYMWSIAEQAGELDEEMEGYVRDHIMNMMIDWIKKYSLENMKINYQTFDYSILKLEKNDIGANILDNDQARLREFFFAVQAEKEELDEELYKLRHQNDKQIRKEQQQ